MEPFVRHRGNAAALPRQDVDTDQIIPKQFLRGVERTGLGASLFFDWRAQPGFELNDPATAGASILITGPNFGCGSSREHAVWALAEYGFRAIVAPSFADIFFANCCRNGVVPVQLRPDQVETLMQRAQRATVERRYEVVVDLAELSVSDDRGFTARFAFDPYRRELLLRGLDEIDRTLLEEPRIAEFERLHP
jgi:3-isopropylmalate/(R)-2-methylmalate dehydratase small subunit